MKLDDETVRKLKAPPRTPKMERLVEARRALRESIVRGGLGDWIDEPVDDPKPLHKVEKTTLGD